MLWSRGWAATILRFGQKIGRKSLYKKTYVQLQELKGMVDMGSLEMVEITGPYNLNLSVSFSQLVYARISAI